MRRKDVSAYLAVPCETCDALEGQYCLRVSGIWTGHAVSYFHRARVDAAIAHYARALREARRRARP